VTLRAKGEAAETIPTNKIGLFAYPNPFNPETQIDLYLPASGTGNVKIYDIRGRMVVELYRGLFANGRNSFVWRGQDSNGWSVASGVYYVKAKTDVKSFTHKLLLLK